MSRAFRIGATAMWMAGLLIVGARGIVAFADDVSPIPQQQYPDPFDDVMAIDELSAVRGGEAVDELGDMGVNLSHQTGQVRENVINAPTTNGVISSNNVQGNRGIAVSNFNSGNFNNFNTTIQLNVFTQ